MSEETSRYRIDPALAGRRLDSAIVELFADTRKERGEAFLSRSRSQSLIAEGHVQIDGKAETRAGRRLLADQVVTVRWPEPEPASPEAQAIPLAVHYEDEAVIVVDKPAGLVVHPGAGNPDGTLVNALLHHCGESLSGIGGVRRPGIVHRLDKDTSGLMVVAKTDAAHSGLAEQFAAHGADGRLIRAYRALVWGVPKPSKGAIDAPLGRATGDRTRRAVVPAGRPDARHARTHYSVLATSGAGDEASTIECRLETGRTHQIRVHCAHIGHPLIGDPVYARGFATKSARLSDAGARAVADLGRQALHAGLLGFRHPLSDRPLLFQSDLPADLRNLTQALDLQ